MSQKRERSINFTREEVDVLIKLVEVNKHILENKKSDAVTWNQKEECWKAIEASFNAASGSTHRTSKNLRLKYEGIKRDTRKKSALIRAETYRTGGGPSTAPVLTPSESKVKNMILLSVDGMESNFDSDNVPNRVVTMPEHKVPPHDPVFDNNVTVVFDTQNQDEIIHSPSDQSGQNRNNVEETPVRPVKRTLFDTQDTAYLEEVGSETITKWSQWKPTSLRSRKHPALGKPKPKRPFEKVADSKMEITILQKKILEEEFINKKLQWAFEEEERQHKREMWELEKKLLLKKLKESNE